MKPVEKLGRRTWISPINADVIASPTSRSVNAGPCRSSFAATRSSSVTRFSGGNGRAATITMRSWASVSPTGRAGAEAHRIAENIAKLPVVCTKRN